MHTWLYIFDEFRPLDIDFETLLELVDKDPLKLFEAIRDVVGEYIRNIEGVEVYDTYIDVHSHEILVEYIVKCEYGETSVKIVHSNNPFATLQKYYRYEEARQRHK